MISLSLRASKILAKVVHHLTKCNVAAPSEAFGRHQAIIDRALSEAARHKQKRRDQRRRQPCKISNFGENLVVDAV